MISAGVDEAGRGCVIGPLVLCIASCSKEAEARLKAMGVKDSKLLSPSSRERLASLIRGFCTLSVTKITAKELNELMKTHSLNEIEAMKIGEAMNQMKFDEAFVDSPDPIPSKFEKRIRRYYKGAARLVCENKADVNHVIVGAASIIAKTERDAEIEKIKKELSYDFNSGYTSDPKTIEFLKKNWQRPDVHKYLRLEWKTVTRLKQRKLEEF